MAKAKRKKATPTKTAAKLKKTAAKPKKTVAKPKKTAAKPKKTAPKKPAKKQAAPNKAPKKTAPPNDGFAATREHIQEIEAAALSKLRAAMPVLPPAVPGDGPALAVDHLLATLATIAPRLAADPIYANEANAPFDAGELEGYFRRADGATLGYLFDNILQGMIQSVRFSALQVVRAAFRDDKQATITTKPALQIPQGGTLAVVGDLVVEGDLENDGVLVVTGDLTIQGAYLGPAFDYSLAAVGGTMRARDVSASGEILVGERLEANRVVHLFYNDYSSILPALKARALVIDDNFPALGTVDAELQIEGTPSDEQLRTIFGAGVEALTDDDESPIRALIKG